MRIPHPRLGRLSWPRLPRHTARLRLTVLYSAAFLACGAGVFGLSNLLYLRAAHPVPQLRFAPNPKDSSYSAAAFVSTVGRISRQAFEASSKQVAYDRQQQLITSAIAFAVFAVATAAIGWLVAGRVLRSLSTITAAARQISASNLHERLALRGPDDELKELADTLDNLFSRLEASFDAQRRFSANASHELRTPLTRERALLQVTLADPDSTIGTWQAVSRELLLSNAEQERLIEALLTLASSEAHAGPGELIDLAVIISAALAAARPAVDRLGLNLHPDIQPAVVDGDPLLVQHLVTNLIDNAVWHNIPGGDIQVSTKTGAAGIVLRVANSGQVIPAAEVDLLFEPFQRLGHRSARRDGHGLGLSIVKAIAITHGAAITAQPRPGGGLSIDVTFPPSTPSRTRLDSKGAAPYKRL
jgi:signal transduction histidine kinase